MFTNNFPLLVIRHIARDEFKESWSTKRKYDIIQISRYRPKYAVSKDVENIKKNTSRSLRSKFAFLKKVYWNRKAICGKGFFVSTVGINEEVIRRYVKIQEKEETGQAKLEF